MYDKQQTIADKIDKAMLEVNSCALDILYKTDGGGNTVIDNFSDDAILFHGLSNYMVYLNDKTNEFTDGVYNVLDTNSRNKGGLTSYALRVNGINPLFGVSHDYAGDSTASRLVGLMNAFQRNKVNLLSDVIGSVYNHNVEVLRNLITVVLKREVLGQKLGVYADVSKIQQKVTTKKVTTGNDVAAGTVGVASTAAVTSATVSMAAKSAVPVAVEKIVEYEVLNGAGQVVASFGGTATTSTELAVIGTEVATAGSTELAVVGTEVATVGSTELAATSTVGSATSGSLFASVASTVVPALIGTAIITAGLTVAVIIETRKRVKKFADAVDKYDNLMKEYVNSFYCNAISYPTLVYDDSNPEGPTVFRSHEVTATSSQLASSIINLNVERAVGMLAGYLSYDTNMYNKVNQFLRNGEGLVTYDDVISCINRILDNIRTIIKQFTLAERKINVDINSIALEVIRGNWGNGAERKAKLEAAGYNYDEIQARVNEILLGTGATVTTATTSVVANMTTTSADTSSTIQYRVTEDSIDSVVLDTTRKEYLEKLELAEKEATRKLAELKEQQQKEMDKLKQEQAEKIEKLKQEQEKELAQLKEQQDIKDAEIEKMKQEQAQELEKLKKQQEQELEKLKQQQAQELEKLKQDNADEISKIKQQAQSTPIITNGSSVNNTTQSSGSTIVSSDSTTDSSTLQNNTTTGSDSESIIDVTEKPSYTTTTTNKVTQTSDKSGNAGVVGAVLGIGALGAAGVVGARYIKKKKENETYSDDENYFSNDEEFSEVKETDIEESDSKYKAGSVNSLVLDDSSDIDTTNSNITSSDTLDFE